MTDESAKSASSARAATPAEPEFDRKQLIKLFIELGPLVVFFMVNWQAGSRLADPKHAIFWGTGAFMVATVISLIASRSLLGRIPTMPLVTGFFVIIFGGLTLWLQNDQFIKMKPTLVNGLFSAILLVGIYTERNFLKLVFGDVMKLSEIGWRKLTWRWAMFFAALAILNEIVWRSFSTDFWVSFKVFGIMPLTMIFAIAQIGLMKRHGLDDAAYETPPT
ncbi:MAG: septation protein A [Hyphomicrobium sp.]